MVGRTTSCSIVLEYLCLYTNFNLILWQLRTPSQQIVEPDHEIDVDKLGQLRTKKLWQRANPTFHLFLDNNNGCKHTQHLCASPSHDQLSDSFLQPTYVQNLHHLLLQTTSSNTAALKAV